MVAKTSVIKELEAIFDQGGNQLHILYGREDSEKEQLVKAFLQNKCCLYYRARQASAEAQLQFFGAELQQKCDTYVNKYTYDEYFRRIKSTGGDKFVLVVDEVQYIAKKDPSFLEAIMKLKDRKLYPGAVMILLCSSSQVWVEKELEKQLTAEDKKKFDGTIKIKNLDFLEVVRAFPQYSVSDCVKVYGIVGGVPGYINRWDQRLDLKMNICRNILSRNGYMNQAAERLISSELRELSVYETILGHIAAGYDKLNDIYQKTGFSRAKISVYMKNLAAFDIIEKVVSFETGGWDNAKKGIYRIKDHYVNFWFHFIYPNLSDLHMMTTDEFYEAFIAPGIDSYLERYFKEVCREYLRLLNMIGKLPMQISKMGTWVGKEGNIDIIAQNSVRENIVGYCNWNEPEFTIEMCDNLFENMRLARISAKYFFLFSAKAFSEEVKALAEEKDEFILIDMNEL